MFEVRGPVNFKNVAKPVMCYWLIENVERSMQEKPTFEHPSEVSLFAELISDPRESSRHDSLITDQESYPHPSVKADSERLGRPRYDSIAEGPSLYSPRSPRTPQRHPSRDYLMSSMPAYDQEWILMSVIAATVFQTCNTDDLCHPSGAAA